LSRVCMAIGKLLNFRPVALSALWASRRADRWRVTESSGEETSQRRRDVREMARTWCRLPHLDSGLLVHDARDRRDEEFRFNRRNGGCKIPPGCSVKSEMSAKNQKGKKEKNSLTGEAERERSRRCSPK